MLRKHNIVNIITRITQLIVLITIIRTLQYYVLSDIYDLRNVKLTHKYDTIIFKYRLTLISNNYLF